MSYEWKRNCRYNIVRIALVLFWLMNIYTQLLHIYNDDTKRILEQFATFGVGCSVNGYSLTITYQTKNVKFLGHFQTRLLREVLQEYYSSVQINLQSLSAKLRKSRRSIDETLSGQFLLLQTSVHFNNTSRCHILIYSSEECHY